MAKKPKAPKPHPDLDHHLLAVGVNVVEMQAKIQREWEKYFAQPFPEWSRDALSGVAAFAGLPADAVDMESPFIIYRKAIEKKKPKRPHDDYYVTMLQMAAVVGDSSKRTIRRMYDYGELPQPDDVGRRGKRISGDGR